MTWVRSEKVCFIFFRVRVELELNQLSDIGAALPSSVFVKAEREINSWFLIHVKLNGHVRVLFMYRREAERHVQGDN